MEMNNKSLSMFDTLCNNRLGNTERLWRDIYRIADEHYLLIRYQRYPLISEKSQYKVTVYNVKDKEWVVLFEEEGMALDDILMKLKKQLNKYHIKNREYLIQKPGSSEMI